MQYMCTFRVFKEISFSQFFSKYSLKDIIYRPKALFCTSRFPIDNIRSLSKDVLLYSYERSKFYKYLSIFGIAQFAVWSFYGGMMYTSMKDIKTDEDLEKYELFTKSPVWKMALGESNKLFLAVAFCILLGVFSTGVCTVLPSRIVKELILCKGGQAAIVTTYGPFGNTLKCEVPLEKLYCVTSRSQAKSYVAIKIKPKWFYYLIDIRGQFHDPKLFDYTIGTKAYRAY